MENSFSLHLNPISVTTLKKYEEQLEALKAENFSLKHQLSQYFSDSSATKILQDAQLSLKILEGEKEDLKKQLENLKAQNLQETENFNNLNSSNEKLRKDNLELSEYIVELRRQLSGNDLSKNDLQNKFIQEIEKYKNENFCLKENYEIKVKELNNYFCNQQKKYQEEIVSLKNKYEERVGEFNNQMGSMQQVNQKLNNELNGLFSEKKFLGEQKNEIEKKFEIIKNENEKLRINLNENQNKFQNLQENIEKNKERNLFFEQENESLKRLNKNLSEDLKILQNEFDNYKRNTEESYKKMNEEYKILQNEFDNYKRNTEESYKKMNEEYKILQNQYEFILNNKNSGEIKANKMYLENQNLKLESKKLLEKNIELEKQTERFKKGYEELENTHEILKIENIKLSSALETLNNDLEKTKNYYNELENKFNQNKNLNEDFYLKYKNFFNSIVFILNEIENWVKNVEIKIDGFKKEKISNLNKFNSKLNTAYKDCERRIQEMRNSFEQRNKENEIKNDKNIKEMKERSNEEIKKIKEEFNLFNLTLQEQIRILENNLKLDEENIKFLKKFECREKDLKTIVNVFRKSYTELCSKIGILEKELGEVTYFQENTRNLNHRKILEMAEMFSKEIAEGKEQIIKCNDYLKKKNKEIKEIKLELRNCNSKIEKIELKSQKYKIEKEKALNSYNSIFQKLKDKENFIKKLEMKLYSH
ncbi:hypothetical protein CWI38_0400p0040 [Hamiltosporidium tvaerminnensis]|uniref:Uncharacterized protein n=1 Tax=Hamiltosporidium tvaerminnensis TaxID=1176355 RepID=A0A4Q9LXL6_9MICR|nr:hypothetical protein CWI38_0400p0040 [Hamiltosporidium tvaerminnensis]